MIANLYVYVAIAIGAFAAGGATAWKVQNWRHDAEKAQQLAEASRMNAKREQATTKVSSKFEQQRTKVQYVTKETIKYVDRFVPASDCPLSGGFRVFHDAAASGEVPVAAGIADAAAVTAKEAAATVADNYGACREDQLRLQGLQEWVREQQSVK